MKGKRPPEWPMDIVRCVKWKSMWCSKECWRADPIETLNLCNTMMS